MNAQRGGVNLQPFSFFNLDTIWSGRGVYRGLMGKPEGKETTGETQA
jgi:hypothetical protein